MRSKTETKMTVCKLNKGIWEIIQSEQETADVLNDYFSFEVEELEDQNLPAFSEQTYIQALENIEITVA